MCCRPQIVHVYVLSGISHLVLVNSNVDCQTINQTMNVYCSRLVYDRETGKPKGYGFCEYQDQETALSAMRNLNGREFSGRALRVDNAASEKNKEELKSKGFFLFDIISN